MFKHTNTVFARFHVRFLFQQHSNFADMMIGVSIFACLGFSLDGTTSSFRFVRYAENNGGTMEYMPSQATNIACLTCMYYFIVTKRSNVVFPLKNPRHKDTISKLKNNI